MTKVQILYCSMYRHIEEMAQAVAEGARKVEGVDAVIKLCLKLFRKTRHGRQV